MLRKDKTELSRNRLTHRDIDTSIRLRKRRSKSLNNHSNKNWLLSIEDKLILYKEIIDLFPGLSNFNHSTIKSYNTSDLNIECKAALTLFTDIILSVRDGRMELKEDLLKISLICLQYCNICLKKSGFRAEGNNCIKHLRAIQSILAMWIDHRNNKAIEDYLTIIYKLTCTSIELAYESLMKTKTIVSYLSCQYQTLGLLIKLSNYKGDTGTELIKLCIESLEKAVRETITRKECNEFQLGYNENWTLHSKKYVATIFNRKMFSAIRIGAGAPKYSIRYIVLYYISKGLKFLPIKTVQFLSEKIMESISEVLKERCKYLLNKIGSRMRYDITEIEIILNEVTVSISIIRQLLFNVKNCITLLIKHEYNDFLKPLLNSCLTLILKLKLVTNTEDSTEMISYRTTKDYLSVIFLFMAEVRTMKKPLRYGAKKTKNIALSAIIEETIKPFINDIDDIPYIKHYVIEYLFDCKEIVTRQTAEDVIKLIGSKIFNFTASSKFNTTPMEVLTNKRILKLLSIIVETDKAWAKTVFLYLLELIAKHTKEEYLFGLCKLVYCGVIGKVYDDNEFVKVVFANEINEMDYEVYIENEDKRNSKAVRGFVEIKGIKELIKILLTCYSDYTDNIREIIMISNLVLELINIPLISEPLLNTPSFLLEFATYSNANKFRVRLTRRLLLLAKYNPKVIDSNTINKDTYLPFHLMKTIKCSILSNQIEEVLPIANLLIEFLNENVPSFYQTTVDEIAELEVLVDKLKESDNSGAMVLFLFKLIKGLQRQNEAVKANINNSKLMQENLLIKLVKYKISKVTLIKIIRMLYWLMK